ncbi:MAG: nucleotidyltransferase domain-containing protein [Defluviitaleaceae bacterium]|nr:nucleotidyltransferase domain-containing protein [Defluviitaleaceae bacterium]
MEKWKHAAECFIASCTFKNEIAAVFLTGSFAFGNADEFSDIDLFIVLSSTTNWRERGNKLVNGLRVEYFANPISQIKKYIENSHASVQIIEINMILGGMVIYNKNHAAEEIIAYCKEKTAEDFPKMSEFGIKTGLYMLWDCCDEMQRAFLLQRPDAALQFYCFIRSAFELYSQFISSPVPGYHKLYRWLTDDDYNKKYGLAVYNDLVFLEMMKAAISCPVNAAMLGMACDIYEYIADKMGGIDMDDFILRGPCEL